jgi:hypothetical protein
MYRLTTELTRTTRGGRAAAVTLALALSGTGCLLSEGPTPADAQHPQLTMHVVGPSDCAPNRTGSCFEVDVTNKGEPGDGFCELSVVDDGGVVLDADRIDVIGLGTDSIITAFLELEPEAVSRLEDGGTLSTRCEPSMST